MLVGSLLKKTQPCCQRSTGGYVRSLVGSLTKKTQHQIIGRLPSKEDTTLLPSHFGGIDSHFGVDST